ncbi:CAP domain-containing protein [Algoriphagus algorifonticola]|uniref:CAP domain-containing protein n=1 Tax=Algoriphagus algorifonticola TaxID=2593007 RepID=UPI0011A89931|nr:CAP domain-containing protein [Algoriphagus algorifonticola]
MPKYFLLSCCFYLSLISTFAQSWSSVDYSKFDWKSFYKLSTAHQELNLSDIDYPLLHAAIFYVSNEFRERNRLKPFIYSDRIERLSADHAADMVKYNFYGHFSKIRNKRTLRDRFQIVGLNPSGIAENISSTAAIQYEYGRKVNRPQSPGIFTYMSNKREVIPNHTYLSYAKAIVQLWMDSPGHRANILNPGFIYMAAGSAVYPERSFYNMPYFMNVQCFSGR